MAFEVVESEIRTIWVQADGASTYYLGQPVVWNDAQATHNIGTVVPMVTASGVYDTAQCQCIAGIVVGFNNYTQLYTSGLEYGGGACATQALQAARKVAGFQGVEGMYGKNDPCPMIQIALVFSNTFIKAPICQGALGTAPTVLTITALGGGADGMVTADTTGTNDAASILGMGTIYFRSGANAGIYRVNKNTSATAPSTTTAFPYDPAVGDTLVAVPFKQGQCVLNYTTGQLYAECTTAPTAAGTNQFGINVYKLDLSTAGKEYLIFSFEGDHFCRQRA